MEMNRTDGTSIAGHGSEIQQMLQGCLQSDAAVGHGKPPNGILGEKQLAKPKANRLPKKSRLYKTTTPINHSVFFPYK